MKNVEQYLNSFGANVVKDAQTFLSNEKGSTDLANTIRFEVTATKDGFSTKFYMADYGRYIDQGVSGNKKTQSYTDYKGIQQTSQFKYKTKQPPPSILTRWIKKKGIKGRDKKGRFITHKSLAFLIGRSIKKRGIKSLSFFQKPFGIWYGQLQHDLLKEVKEDIQTYLTTWT
jgi:hypothetical protein